MDNFLNGILPLYKPCGVTSMEVARRLKRILPRKQKIGHLGTLDPMAEGVLPLLLGEGTKLFDLLINTPKAYEFDVSFGSETDTLDAEGQLIRSGGPTLFSKNTLVQALATFSGGYEQVPPLYSALKHKGKPLYSYARKGDLLEIPLDEFKKKFVTFYDLKLLGVKANVASIYVSCSKGTYVRSFARDFSYHLGAYGTVTLLKRVNSGGFNISDCAQIPQDADADLTSIKEKFVPINKAPLPYPQFIIKDSAAVRKLRFGNPVSIPITDNLEFLSIIKDQLTAKETELHAVGFFDDNENILGLGIVRYSEPHTDFMLQVTRGFNI